MIENLKMILDVMKNWEKGIPREKYKGCVFSLECAIEILEKIKYEERSIQNGNIE